MDSSVQVRLVGGTAAWLLLLFVATFACTPGDDDDSSAGDDVAGDDDAAADNDADDDHIAVDDDAEDDDFIDGDPPWEVVDPGFIQPYAMARTPDGVLHLSLSVAGLTYIARIEGGAVQTEAVLTVDFGVRLAADDAGHLHLIATPGFAPNESRFAYFNNVSGHWERRWSSDNANAVDLAVAPDGTAHLAVVSDERTVMNYLTNASGEFVAETVDKATNAQWIPTAAIVLDGQQRPHLSYPKGLFPFHEDKPLTPFYFGRLTYAVRQGGQWNIETLTAPNTGWNTALALDADGNASIAYTTFFGYDELFNYLGDTHVITNRANGWQSTKIAAANSGDIFYRLFVDETGAAHLFYILYDLTYWTDGGGAWQQVDELNVDNSQVAADPAGFFHLTSVDLMAGLNKLVYANNETGSFKLTTLLETDNKANGLSAVTGPGGEIHAIYPHGFGDVPTGLREATQGEDGWAIAELPVTPVPDFVSAAIDANGATHLAYLNDRRLFYANNAGGGWLIDLVVDANVISVALALDGDGRAHVAFTRWSSFEENAVYYATNASGEWVGELVDSQGEWPSLAIDDNGAAHVVYTDQVDKLVKYATNQGGGWPVVTLHTFIDSNYSRSALAFDAEGVLHACYGNGHIGTDEFHQTYYATKAGGDWAEEEIDLESGGDWCAIAFAADGTPVVGYSSYRTSPAVQYARRVAADNWQRTTVADEGSGSMVGLWIDAAGRVHLLWTIDYSLVHFPAGD